METALPAGTVIASRYEVLRLLGRGGMGVVYQARDRLLDEVVALKVLKAGGEDSPQSVQRFLQEIKLARAVSHRHVGRIHEYGEDQGLRFISMAYVDGVDLKTVLGRRGALPIEEALGHLVGVAEGLQAIHDEGIVHRDLKTANIMLDSRGQVRLMDFGIAKQWDAGEAAGLTGAGRVIGTPEYMSPEQIRADRLDGRSDVYALGVVAYELLTGHPPFQAETPVEVLVQHLRQPPPLDVPGIPESLRPLLATALAKHREERFPTARALGAALEEARRSPSAVPTLVPRLERTQPPQPARREKPLPGPTEVLPVARQPTLAAERPGPDRRAAFAGLALALAGLALGGLAWLGAPPRPAPTPRPAPATIVATSPTPAPPLVAAPATTLARAEVPAAPRPRREPPPSTSPPAPAPSPDPRLAGLIAQAEEALGRGAHQEALSRYDEALRLDPGNPIARLGRAAALGAQTAAEAAARPRERPGRRFVAGASLAESPETRAEGEVPDGFRAAPGIAVTRDSQAAALPGELRLEAEPDRVQPGDPFTVRVWLANGGAAPIEVAGFTVTTTVNGRRAGGPVVPLTRQVAPRQKALLLSLSEGWRGDVESWKLAVAVRTGRSELYRSELEWR
jgi:serine/threonine-protein kinase